MWGLDSTPERSGQTARVALADIAPAWLGGLDVPRAADYSTVLEEANVATSLVTDREDVTLDLARGDTECAIIAEPPAVRAVEVEIDGDCRTAGLVILRPIVVAGHYGRTQTAIRQRRARLGGCLGCRRSGHSQPNCDEAT